MMSSGADFGPYTLNAEIGRGAMGVVYAATQKTLNRQVALKVLRPEFLLDEDYRARFGREAASLAQLSSPHVPHIYEFGEHDSQLFIASQLIAGGNLDQLITQRRSLPVGESLSLAFQVASALRDAHSVRVIHRDVKPSNVLLHGGVDPYAYLCDFGIARSLDSDVSATQALIGTLSYLAPERFNGVAASPASDLYSLGCLLWAMLSGSAPYLGTSTHVMMQHVREPIPTFESPSPQTEGVNYILQRAMAKDPANRYASAEEMMADLTAAHNYSGRQGAGQTVIIPRTPLAPPPAVPLTVSNGPSRRRRSPALIAALVLLAGAAVFGVGWASVSMFGDDDGQPTSQTSLDGTADEVEADAPSEAPSTDPETAEAVPGEAGAVCAANFYCLPAAGVSDPLAGDFDGDEDPDFAVVARNDLGGWGVSVAHSAGIGFESQSTWTDLEEWTDGEDTAVAADFTGDKFTDVMVLRQIDGVTEASLLKGTVQGLGPPQQWAELASVPNVVSAAAGRFDGDKRADLAVLTGTELLVVRSQGDSGGTGERWGRLPGGNLKDAQLLGRNFDSDDVADIVVARRGGGGKWVFDAWLSSTSQFSGPFRWGTLTGEPHSFVARDVDRNQFIDLVALTATNSDSATISVLLNNGTKFKRATGFDASLPTPQARSAMLFGGDFNNDLKADVAVVHDPGDSLARADVWISQGTSFAAPKPLGVVAPWRWN